MSAGTSSTPSVLMVAARFPPYVGGIETHVRAVADILHHRGVGVGVLTTDPRGGSPSHDTEHGYAVDRVAAYPRWGDLYFAPAIVSKIRRSEHDLVHVQGIHTLVAPMAMAAALAAGKRLVVTFHTGGHRSSIRRKLRSAQWRAMAPMLRRSSALIAVSEFERAMIARSTGIDPSRIQVIRNGSDVSQPAIDVAEDPDLVLSVGRLERYKGHHRAVSALPYLIGLRPRARLAIIGSGPEHHRLERQARFLGLDGRVTIRSVAANDRLEMARALAEAALVVLLSEYEAHPVAIAEARALGRRVLVADTSGLSELAARGEATSVALQATPQELAATMDRVMRQPAPSPTELPGWDACVDQLIDVYRSVAPARKRNAHSSIGSLVRPENRR